jgi:hypothetical protein
MEKRKFRGDRLYKVAKIIVVLLTIYFAADIANAYFRKIRVEKAKDSCKDTGYTECIRLNYMILSNIEDDIRKNTYVAIFLPLVFFGGKKLFEYIFPSSQKNEKETT